MILNAWGTKNDTIVFYTFCHKHVNYNGQIQYFRTNNATIWKKITKLFFGEACSFIDPILNISLISTNGSLVVWGPVVWIPGILIWKGLLLKGTLRISNHRDSNQQLTMNWWELIHNNTIYFHQWCFSSSYLLGLETLPRKKKHTKNSGKNRHFLVFATCPLNILFFPHRPPPASENYPRRVAPDWKMTTKPNWGYQLVGRPRKMYIWT